MPAFRHRQSRAAVIVVCVAVLGAYQVAGTARQAASSVPGKADDPTIVHVLNRLGFGPRPGDIERVRALGLETYIEQQLRPERIDDGAMQTRLAGLTTLDKDAREIAETYYLPAQQMRRAQQGRDEQRKQMSAGDPAMPSAPGAPAAAGRDGKQKPAQTPEQMEAARLERQAFAEVPEAKVLRAAYSERQLEELLVDFWFNHFNVFSGKGVTRLYVGEYEREVIRPHVLGKFRDLLGSTAESPAMLFYLDNWQSAANEGAPIARPAAGSPRTAPIDRPRQRPDMFGTPRVRPGRINAPRLQPQPPAAQNRRRGLNENYARELMELHTLGVDGGYTQKDVQEVARAFTGWTIANPRQGGGFRFEPRVHDDGAKVVLGQTIGAGGGKADGDRVLDLLAKHPSTATFISTKLVRRLVSDTPPPALVARAAKRFAETDGDIREVVRTIVTAPEFYADEAYRAKVKSPFEFVVSAVRATGAEAPNAQPLVQAVRTLGMPIYGSQPPTGYPDKAEAWVNSGALLNRMNFAVSLTSEGGRGSGRGGRAPATVPATMTADAVAAAALAGEISAATSSTIAKATTPAQQVALLLGSPEFQRK